MSATNMSRQAERERGRDEGRWEIPIIRLYLRMTVVPLISDIFLSIHSLFLFSPLHFTYAGGMISPSNLFMFKKKKEKTKKQEGYQ